LIDKKYNKNYEFLEYVDEKKLKHLYSQCTIFVAPSIYESFGIIFLEAMNEKKPVIGTNVGGIPEIINDGETGLLVEPGDSINLATKINDLLSHPEKSKLMGEKGKDRLKNYFSADAFAEKTISIYQKILSEKSKQ
jgi:glycosyltransferase involved in cell wall biosynthesis